MEKSKRTIEQEKAFEAWQNNSCFGTIEGATGFGKSRIGVKAASFYAKKYNYNFSILIIVPDTNLRDNEWRKEFEKWEEKEVFEKCVTIECIQTVYKWKDTKWDLVIVDEIHDIVPSIKRTDFKYGTFFFKNKYRGLLGLSGSIDKDRKPMLKYIAPIVYSLHTEEAKEKEFISDFHIYTIGVELTEEERKEYDKLSRGIELSKRHNWAAITKRVEILYRAKNKVKLAEEIIKNTSTRGILFNMRNDVSTYFTINSEVIDYHSNLTKTQRNKNLELFQSKKKRVISTTKALNQGANLENITWAIIIAGTSKEKDVIQRLGRIVRRETLSKKAILFRLYCKNTVEELHLKSSLKKFKSYSDITPEKLSEIYGII